MSASVNERVGAGVLLRCFWRSLFLQAAWNRRGMQNLGFAYAIDPALRRLYPESGQHRAALARHLGFFNCHPYTAAAILGGAIHHEERVAAGLELPGTPVAFKATLQGPLAAIGDGFFWTALRPFFGGLAAVGGLFSGWPLIFASLALYNLVHLALRIGLFRTGYRRGDAVVGVIGRLSLPAYADRLRLGGAALCGFAAAVVAVHATVWPPLGPWPGSGTLVSAAISVLGYFALSRGVPLLPATFGAILVGLGSAFMGWRFHGSLW